VKPTKIRMLLAVAVVAGLLSWSLARAWAARSGTVPQVPWSAAVVIGVFAAAVLAAAAFLRPRLRRRPGHRPLHPLVAARFAVLALASSRAGAALIGLYGGFAVSVLDDLDTDYRRRLAVVAGVCVAAGVLLTVAGLVLERVCRLPPDEPEDPGTLRHAQPA